MIFYRSGNAQVSTGGVTYALPAGWQPNDLLILLVECSSADTVATPAGWTPFAASPQLSTDTKLYSFWRRAVSGDASVVLADAGNHIAGMMLAFAGVVTTGNPFADVQFASLNNTAAFNFPTVTVPAAGHAIFNIVGHGRDSGVNSLTSITQPNTDQETLAAPWTATTGGDGGSVNGFFAVATAAGAQTSSGSLGYHKNLISLVMIPEPDEKAYVWNSQFTTTVVTQPTTRTLMWNFQMITVTAPPVVEVPDVERRRNFMSFIP